MKLEPLVECDFGDQISGEGADHNGTIQSFISQFKCMDTCLSTLSTILGI